MKKCMRAPNSDESKKCDSSSSEYKLTGRILGLSLKDN